MGRLSRDKRDVFYRLAKETGYRARSAFKLLQIDSHFDLFGSLADDGQADSDGSPDVNDVDNGTSTRKHRRHKSIQRAVDLCAAPGGWTQVMVQSLSKKSEVNREDGAADVTKEVPKIVAVDLWPMEPIEGVDIIRGDITSLDTARQIIDCFEGKRAEVHSCCVFFVSYF
jgi:tRNA (cytidine32/guanosine34-2'-O)-methyltransferase